MDRSNMLHVKDVQTGRVFKIRPGETTVFVTTTDGVRVKLHPTIIKLMVKQGHKFEGQSPFGGREMIKL